MDKITLTVEGSTVGAVAKGGGIKIEKSVSEQDSGRLIAAYARTYNSMWIDGDSNPRSPSIQEVIEAWFNGIIRGSIDHVQAVEKEKAAETAQEVVQPIVVV